MAEGRIVGVEAAEANGTLLGGKALNLLELSRGGLPVPAWFCVTTAVFDELVGRVRGALDGVLQGLEAEDRQGLEAASARIRELLQGAGLAGEDASALRTRLKEAFPAEAHVAVRSSCVGEDSAGDSFAGQMDSFLYVKPDAVSARVVDCFASAFSPRALLYRKLRGLDLLDVKAAAVVQRMVESRVSGVLFTANPTSGDRTETVIAAGLGLGEGVVGDLVETDTYYVESATGAVRSRLIKDKSSKVVFDADAGTGTRVVEVTPDLRPRPALTDQEVASLAALGQQAQTLRGGPQDLEWALDRSGACLLQTRPITTLERGRETIFDNANIVESYPGISSPLTFSFARSAYEATFREASRRLGVSARILAFNHAVHANLVGLVDGRIYYNILNWYRLYMLVPGFERFLPAFEKALGLKHLYLPQRPRQSLRQRLGYLPQRLRVVASILVRFAQHARTARAFNQKLEASARELFRADLKAEEPHALIAHYERITRDLLAPYAVSVINDIFVQQLFELLGVMIERWRVGSAESLRNDLLAGESGMESVAPVRSILALAERIRNDEALRAAFEQKSDPVAVWTTLRGDPRFDSFNRALDRHLEQFGDRTLHELKLETPPLDENPTFIVAMLRNYLRGRHDVADMEAHEQAIRRGAEAQVAEALRGHPLRRLLFRVVLRWVRRTVKFRENLRLARTRAFGLVKRVFRALGCALADRGRIEAKADVFYLALEELIGEVRGHAVTRDLHALIALRKREYETFGQREPAARIHAYGPVYAAPFTTREEAARASGTAPPEEGQDRDTLHGIGCSKGIVRARAKVITDPNQDLRIDGEILVAPMTDPGWVFLMVSAGGIMVERGSPLSHTAIIGRELGIPTVVGVEAATRRVRDGEWLELDGRSGVIRRVAGPEPDDRSDG